MKKQKLIYVILGLFFIVNFGLVLGAITHEYRDPAINFGDAGILGFHVDNPIKTQFFGDNTDIGVLNGLKESEITGKGINYDQYQNKDILLTFVNDDAEVDVKGDKFANIVSQEKSGHPTFIQLDKNGKIERADFTVNENGGTYVFGNTEIYAPPNSRIFFNKESGIEMAVQDKAQIPEFPRAKDQNFPAEYLTIIKSAYVKTESYPGINFISDKGTFNLPNGAVIKGALGFDNGQAFFGGRESIWSKSGINNVDLSLPDRFDIFFDGQEPGGSYVSFGKDKLTFSTNYEKRYFNTLTFREGNPYILIEKEDNFAIRSDAEFSIRNRDSEGLIPEIITKGDVSINENGHIIDYSDGLLNWQKGGPRTGYSSFGTTFGYYTSPVEISMFDNEWRPLFDGDKIVVDNFNRFAFFVPYNEGEYDILSEGVNTKFSSRIKYNYPSKEGIESLTGKKITFNSLKRGEENEVLGKLRDYWQTLTPETQNSFGEIEVNSKDSFSENYPYLVTFSKMNVRDIGGFASPFRKVVFQKDDFTYDTFRHEAAHEHHFDLNWQYVQEQDPSGLIPSFTSPLFSSPFEKEWVKIGNHDYGKFSLNSGISFESEYGDSRYNEFKDIPSEKYFKQDRNYVNKPQYGVVNPYGGKNVMEDVATFVEKARDPFFFKDLISPESQKYDIRYRQKIDLLKKYNFITNEEYARILQYAGVK